SLYVATDHRVKQIDLAMCNRRYDNCFRCVRDPYCGWIRRPIHVVPMNWIYCSYEIKYTPTKYIETTERGLVVVSVNEADGGRYDCHLGGSLLCSYNITVDAH
ncbi:hypothetical protein DOY81_012025, partial [Sarcophaga bullata]